MILVNAVIQHTNDENTDWDKVRRALVARSMNDIQSRICMLRNRLPFVFEENNKQMREKMSTNEAAD